MSMRRKKRSAGFMLTTLCTFALLMAASGLSAFSFVDGSSYHARHGASVMDTPDAASTDIPGAAATDVPGADVTDTPGAAATDTQIGRAHV